jgi:prophage regulatory protein
MANRKSMTLAECKELAEHWEEDWERHCYESAVDDHFRGVPATQMVSMWETQTNEKGQKLSLFEFRALCSAWLQTFGCLPPGHEAGEDPSSADQAPEPEPADDTMLGVKEVVRLTDISISTIKRMVIDGRFPKPMHLSPRRIGWLAREVKAWLRNLDQQRSASRQ